MNRLEFLFPNLTKVGYKITSSEANFYNCIAWAAGENNRWWEPDPMDQLYWPPNVPRENTLNAYVKAFESLGYASCTTVDCENGFEKIALYVDQKNIPTHAAKQLSDGKWTSKLGALEDISHNSLEALTNSDYGRVGPILKRPI